jgi:hypothetical protein
VLAAPSTVVSRQGAWHKRLYIVEVSMDHNRLMMNVDSFARHPSACKLAQLMFTDPRGLLQNKGCAAPRPIIHKFDFVSI